MKCHLYHVTPRRNVSAILAAGLRVECCTGRMRGVWLCEGSRLPWAVAHVGRHHQTRPEDMAILSVEGDGMLLRFVRPGVWVTPVDVAVKYIGDVNFFAMGEPQ
jgi:hypothetical protein